MKYKKHSIIIVLMFLFVGIYNYNRIKRKVFGETFDKIDDPKFGTKVDSLNGVYVYYNGSVGNVQGRNVSKDGYNIGLKYQCVEFVKRYYYEYLNHKMTDSYGHAKSFFNPTVGDGKLNKQRNLIQLKNPSNTKPKMNDLIVFDGSVWNKYGHVAIISDVRDGKVEIIQQNPGATASSRVSFDLIKKGATWYIDKDRVLGSLRKVE